MRDVSQLGWLETRDYFICALVSVEYKPLIAIANKSATSCCNGSCETARHNGPLLVPTCYGLAMGKLVQWILAFNL